MRLESHHSGCPQEMIEPEESPSTPDANQNNENRTEPVTAARRTGNLETIRKQPGWQDFPECLPLPMRTTKSGKVTEFGNTKLRILERISVNADFTCALRHLKILADDGTRLLSLKDLESCAAYFDKPRKSSTKRGSSSAPLAGSSVGPSQSDEDEQSQQLIHGSLEPWNHVGMDEASIPLHSGPPASHLKRTMNDSLINMSQAVPMTTNSKRARVETFYDHQAVEMMFSMPDDVMNNMGIPRFPNQESSAMRDTPSYATMSPQDPSQVLFNTYPHAGPLFSSMNQVFDDLLAKAEDQRQLVSTALNQLRMANTGLDTPNDHAADIGNELLTAQRRESRTRRELEQARSARDVIEIQYGHIDNSLSRALLGTVRDEYTRAEATVNRAVDEVEKVRQKLSRASSHEAALQRTKETAEASIDQLQRQTRFWLKRLGEVGVKLTDQLGTMQADPSNPSNV